MGNNAGDESARGWLIPFAATILAMMALQMSNLGSSPLLKEIQKEFGMSNSLYGTFTGMYGLSALLLSVPGGMLAKRYGERIVMSTSLLVVALGLCVLSQVWSTPTVFAGRAVYLLGYRPAFVCVMTAIALAAPLSLRSRSMGMVGVITAIGSAIGARLGASIGRDFGWRNGILSFGGIVFVGAFIFYFAYSIRPERNAPRIESKSEKAKLEAPSVMTKNGSVFRNPVIWALAVLEGIVGVGYFSSNWFIPGAVEMIFGRKDGTAANILYTGYMAAIVANVIFGYLMDRFNKWNVMGLMMLILIPASLCMNTTNILLFYIASSLVLSVGLSAAQQCFSLAAELVPAREMGNVMGMVSLGPGIFGYVGPQMLGWLRDWTRNYTAGWYFLAIVALISLSLVVYIKRYIKVHASAA
ncbi:MAG TPA: MFS transporter [Acidobacteriota bacterium]|nr:MFS transporter [Acidobacteriota bacterium]